MDLYRPLDIYHICLREVKVSLVDRSQPPWAPFPNQVNGAILSQNQWDKDGLTIWYKTHQTGHNMQHGVKYRARNMPGVYGE
jgi:hypothetical protein